MKIRNGFVSNSSACSFFITNLSTDEKTLVDFVKENYWLVEQFNNEFNYDYSYDEVINSAEDRNITFLPDEKVQCIFGDEDGDAVGHIFDYILRDGFIDENGNWEWELHEMLR